MKLWDVETGALKRTFLGPTDGITEIALSPDGQTLVSGDWDGIIFLWDLASEVSIETDVTARSPQN